LLEYKIKIMLFTPPQTLESIANLIQAELIGNPNDIALGINEIHRVSTGDICFVDHPKYYNKCLSSNASHIIINNKDVDIPEGKNLLVCADPFEAYLTIVNHFRPFTPPEKSISDDITVGKHTTIMPQVYIGKKVIIGDNCVIHPHVSIMDYTVIGNNVVIQSGTRIGGDAFYYNGKKNREVWYKRMQSCGNVVIEDDVEIGCNCTIDRGVTASTIIRRGARLDNLIHLGHDVEIGKNCLIAAQVGIAGGTVLEDGVTLWGQVGVNKTIRIGASATVMGQSGVTKSIQGGKTYFGLPAAEAIAQNREMVWIKRIPAMWEKVQQLWHQYERS
jgi:UDP-3-O-[3-hydroxymyristoyl] glucosamine N-acyltransferase